MMIASCIGGTVMAGGAFAVDGSKVERLDTYTSSGMAFDGRQLARILSCGWERRWMCEVLVYDEAGVARYHRLDRAPEAHDIAWDGDELVVVATWENAARWFSPAGEFVREVRLPGRNDCMHLNCLTRHEGIWYATRFGVFDRIRGWDSPGRDGAGDLIELESGRVLVSGLSAPHTPRFVDGMLLVCDSGQDRMLAFDPSSGKLIRQVELDAWARGIVSDDNFFYIGESRRTVSQEYYGCTTIAVVDRRTWKCVDRIPLPAREIYELLDVPRWVVESVRGGFGPFAQIGAPPPRPAYPASDPLEWNDFRAHLTTDIPATCVAGDMLHLPVRILNLASREFISLQPSPVYLSYKWLDPRTGAFLDDVRALRAVIEEAIPPMGAASVTARVIVPMQPGEAILRMTLMQEGVAWFDEVDKGTSFERTLTIVEN